MFNKITGLLRFKNDFLCHIEIQGLEWEILISRQTSLLLPVPGDTASLFLILIHKEDQMNLYGFASDMERDLFRSLLKVNGVGPKQAIRILSFLKPEDLIKLLQTEQLEIISKIPGVGLKTAQKILLTLKGKLVFNIPETPSLVTDITEALGEMGFDKKRASKTIENLLEQYADAGLSKEQLEQEIFKQAIVLLSR